MELAQAKTARMNLETLAQRWRKCLTDAAIGPLLVSVEVMAEAHKWSGPIPIGKWLRQNVHPNHGIAWYSRRAEAVDYFGKKLACYMHHDAAVWAVSNTEDHFKDKMAMEIARVYRVENKGMYVTVEQATRVLLIIMGKPGRGKEQKRTRSVSLSCETCKTLAARIKRLEAQITSLGEVPTD